MRKKQEFLRRENLFYEIFNLIDTILTERKTREKLRLQEVKNNENYLNEQIKAINKIGHYQKVTDTTSYK